MADVLDRDLLEAGRSLAAAGLVGGFGHVSARRDATTAAITPPRPLAELDAGTPALLLALDDDGLADSLPKEAWIHKAIYRARPDVRAICRATPTAVNRASAAGVRIRALHGQGAFVGAEVAVHADARLVRDAALAGEVAAALADGDAVVLRGNGAVTVGATPGEAVARMSVLEASAELNLAASVAGSPVCLTADELASWRAVAPEILPRIWSQLRSPLPNEETS